MTDDPHDWLGVELSGGRYRVIAKLGQGGMGAVYKARDANLDCDVVVKVPHPLMLQQSEFAQRFAQEIRSLVQLTHPHIVKISDVGQRQGTPFAVMAYLAGGDLDERRPKDNQGKSLPMSAESLTDWLPAVAEALDFVHKKGYVHRDIKPANILFDDNGYAHVSDFGIVKTFVDSSEAEQSKGLTGTGMVLGTADYMAPEVVLDDEYDGRADQYSLAVTIYALLSGRQPFVATKPAAVLVAKATQSAPPLASVVAQMPQSLCAAVDRALLRDPTQRFANCSAFAAAALATSTVSSPSSSDPSEPIIAQLANQRPDIQRPGAAPPTAPHSGSKTQSLPSRRATATVSVGATEQAPSRESATTGATAGNFHRKDRWIAAVCGLGLISLLLAVVVLIVVMGGGNSLQKNQTNPLVRIEDEYPKGIDKGHDDNKPQEAPEPPRGYFTNSIGMELVWIPAGQFLMGRSVSDSEAKVWEKPQHWVKITKPYYLGVSEVTQRQYEQVMGAQPWQGKSEVREGDNYPATYVSWNDAVEFCRKLSEREGAEYRLPTEAEWEYACRAGTTTLYSFGDDASRLGQYAWYAKNASDVGEAYAHRVGQKLPNPWGLYDMHGNVHEWCQDWWSLYDSESASDPMGPAEGENRLLRGGTFSRKASSSSSVSRGGFNADERNFYYGFRAVRTADLPR